MATPLSIGDSVASSTIEFALVTGISPRFRRVKLLTVAGDVVTVPIEVLYRVPMVDPRPERCLSRDRQPIEASATVICITKARRGLFGEVICCRNLLVFVRRDHLPGADGDGESVDRCVTCGPIFLCPAHLLLVYRRGVDPPMGQIVQLLRTGAKVLQGRLVVVVSGPHKGYFGAVLRMNETTVMLRTQKFGRHILFLPRDAVRYFYSMGTV